MALSSAYSDGFFVGIRQTADPSARAIVPLLCEAFHPASVLDVGCGDGTWLSAFREAGVPDLLGIDGPWVNPENFAIGRPHFQAVDLSRPYGFPTKFDLVISLEVGEHLPPSSAGTFIRSLTTCGDLILFSAAIPGQGGTHHVNEQWPDYWIRLFAHEGFTAIDWLRPQIWNHPAIAWWYQQNALLCVRTDSLLARRFVQTGYERFPVVHRGHYEMVRRELAAAQRQADLRHRPIRHLLRAAAGNAVRRILR